MVCYHNSILHIYGLSNFGPDFILLVSGDHHKTFPANFQNAKFIWINMPINSKKGFNATIME